MTGQRSAATPSQGRVYATLASIAAGMLVAGLAIPFVMGEEVRSDDRLATGGRSSIVGAAPPDTVPAPAASADDVDGTASTPSNGVSAGVDRPEPAGATRTPGRPGAPAARSPSASPGDEALTATDRGVTATTIKVGFLLLDVASATRFAGGLVGIDPAQQRKAIEVYLSEINERGGVNGRQIEGAYRTFDVLSRDDQRAACLHLTQDEKVFAVIAAGGYGGPPVLCITEENQTPFINLSSGGTPTQYVDRSGGRLFTLFQLGDRQMSNWVADLVERGALKGKKIGILSDESSDPGDLVVGGALIPALDRAGYEVTHRSRLSADLGVGAGQIPVEVQQMRSKGVDAVLLPAHSTYSSQFASAAENQRWFPDWYVSDFSNMSSDAIAENMPDSFEGALALTVTRTGEDLVGRPEPAADAACRSRYEAATGEPLPRVEDGEYNNTYGTTLYSCGMVKLFEAAADAVGPELTRPRFTSAMQDLGDVPLPRFGGGSFRPGKFDATDLVRTNQWFADCTCWKPIDEFRPTPF